MIYAESVWMEVSLMNNIRRRVRKRTSSKQMASSWTKRRILSWSLFVLAVVVAAQHMFAHLGYRPIPLSMGLQDILIGYPTAIVLAIIGAVSLDPNPRI